MVAISSVHRQLPEITSAKKPSQQAKTSLPKIVFMSTFHSSKGTFSAHDYHEFDRLAVPCVHAGLNPECPKNIEDSSCITIASLNPSRHPERP